MECPLNEVALLQAFGGDATALKTLEPVLKRLDEPMTQWRAADGFNSLDAARFGEVVYANVIMMPKIPELEPPEEPTQPKVIDERSEPAGSLSDGRTPDRGNHEDHTT